MTKFKFFTDLEKEERWLEEMLENGYQLYKKSFSYDFVKCQPEKTFIRVDYREFKTEGDFKDYCTLFGDSGWVHIAGTKNSGYQYFKKIATVETNDDFFSDEDSRAGRYKRIARMWLSFAIIFLPILVANIVQSQKDAFSLLSPKTLYLTPGLWELEGMDFWRAFLFETPFAILRAVPYLWILIALALYAGFSLKFWFLYKNKKGN